MRQAGRGIRHAKMRERERKRERERAHQQKGMDKEVKTAIFCN